jgi:hypothetical protein
MKHIVLKQKDQFLLAIFLFFLIVMTIARLKSNLITRQLKFSRNNQESINKQVQDKPTQADLVYSIDHISDWIDPRFYSQNSSEIQQNIQVTLNNEIQLDPSSPSLEKSVKIGGYVLTALDDKRGQPNKIPFDSFYELWIKINQGKTSVFCYHFVAMYALFANSAGIPTRLVYISSFYQNKPQEHVVAESFISEKNKWIMVDLTRNQAYIKNQQGEIFDAYQVVKTYSRRNPNDSSSLLDLNLIMHDTVQEFPVNLSLEKSLMNHLHVQHKYFNDTTRLTYKLYQPSYKEISISL